MKRFMAICALVSSFLISPSRADQLAWNSGPDAEKAVRHLQEGIAGRKGEPYYIVSYCSQCDQERVEIWEVTKVEKEAIPNEDFFELKISGRRMLRSVELIREGKYAESIQYEAVPDAEAGLSQQEVDLAYIYARSRDGSFACLGKTLGLECQVQVERINIPNEVLDKAMEPPVAQIEPPLNFKDAVFASIELVSDTKCVVVVLEDDGTTTLACRRVTMKELSGLKDLQGLPDGFGVSIRARPNSMPQQLMECLDALVEQGVSKITVISE